MLTIAIAILKRIFLPLSPAIFSGEAGPPGSDTIPPIVPKDDGRPQLIFMRRAIRRAETRCGNMEDARNRGHGRRGPETIDQMRRSEQSGCGYVAAINIS